MLRSKRAGKGRNKRLKYLMCWRNSGSDDDGDDRPATLADDADDSNNNDDEDVQRCMYN